MRGSPLLRACLAFAALLTLGLPVWKLTHRAAVAKVVEQQSRSDEQEVMLELAFTSPPRSVRVFHLEKELVHADNGGAEFRAPVRMEFPKEGVDLRFQITWPGTATTAVRIALTAADGERHEKTLWARGELDEVLTFP